MTDAFDRDEQPLSDGWDQDTMPGPPIDVADGLPAEETTAVRIGMLRSPVMHASEPRRPETRDVPVLESMIDLRLVGLHAVPLILIAAAFLAVGQGGLGLAAAAFTGAVLVMRRIGRHVRFGFGDGFIGYRGSLGWPRGVQEEYDVSWGASRQRPSRTGA